MLEIKKICFGYTPQTRAIKDVNLTIKAGEFIGIAGRNGSGKTTLVKLMMSLIKPLSGQILISGLETAKYTPADMARYVGYVFQNPDRQIFRDTVEQEVAYGPEQLEFSVQEKAAAVEEALHLTGLSELADRYPRALSKGQRQRITIASALAMKPKMLILDEPTSGQDVWERKKLMQLLMQLNKSGITIVMVTHDMDLLSNYVERVIVMAKGSKVFDGPVAEVFKTQHDLSAWGLCQPAVVHISQQIAPMGINTVTQSSQFCTAFVQFIRGDRNE